MEYIAEKEAAEFLGLSLGTLRNWRTAGKGPRYYILPYHRVRYTKADLLEWTENNKKTRG